MDEDKLQRLEQYLAGLEKQSKVFEMSDMILRDDSPNPVEYCETGELTDNTHAGQMKLLLADEMSIMLGLLHICEKERMTLRELRRRGGNVSVVVTGAAPGIHFVDLALTFGFVSFHLYDPAPRGWYGPLRDPRKAPNVTLKTQEFTEETADEWHDKLDKKVYNHVIFLSDLRTGNGMEQEGVAGDMDLQAKIVKAMKPSYSVLKFRPRYHSDDTPDHHKTLKYFDGTIYLQGYPRNHSTETRLHVTDPNSEKSYDIKKYEDQLFYHNQVTRNTKYVAFEPGELSYDNAHSQFVERFLLEHLPRVSYRQVRDVGDYKFNHQRIRALLEKFKLLFASPTV